MTGKPHYVETVDDVIPGNIGHYGYNIVRTHRLHSEVSGEYGEFGSMIGMIRNPYDTMVSLYHFLNQRTDESWWHGPKKISMSDVIRNKDKSWHGILSYGIEGYVRHVNSYKKWDGEFLLLSYEELVANPLEGFREAAEFCGIEYDGGLLSWAIREGSFKNVHRHEIQRCEVPLFTRCGEIGQEYELSYDDKGYIDEHVRKCPVLEAVYG